MTDRDELIALRDAVVAGKWDHSPDGVARKVFPYRSASMDDMGLTAVEAFNGSVDAAIALLEAVLPRTQFHLSDEASGDGYVGQIFDCELDRYTGTGHDAIASRALLLAILNAMIERGNP